MPADADDAARSGVVGIIVAHDALAAALVRAVEKISGVTGVLRPISNVECTPAELERRVEAEVGEGPALVFVDMASGSCAFAGQRVARSLERVAVVTGVSLPMLLDFVFHREMDLPALADRVAAKARSAVTSVPPRTAESADAHRTPEN